MSVIFRIFTSWRMAVVFLLGFSSGIPLALTGSTLQAWMKTENIDLTTIGLFSLVGLPYGFKYLWAPFMDRYVPPFLGRRRGWMVVCQAALVLGITAMAFSSPTRLPIVTAALAVLIAFFSASQDIVVDAYRTDLVQKDEMGPAAALYIAGYRIAMLVSGAVALILADHLPWRLVYLIMALTMSVGVVASFFAPEPDLKVKPPQSMTEAVILPFVEFFKRKGAIEVLVFVILYKLDVVVATGMMTPFMLDIGFTKTDIGAVTKGFGLAATLLGTMVGGGLMIKIGMKRSLWFFGMIQGVSGMTFWLLAHVGHSYPVMVAAIAIENVCSGLGTAAFSAFMMSICDKRFTATQYALLSSFMGLSRVIGQAPCGWLAETFGWQTYYLISVFIMIPGLLLLTRFSKWTIAEPNPNPKPALA